MQRRLAAGWALLVGSIALLVAGCASPGPPRAPSLQLPATVSDLVATRRGEEVELQFAVPTRTTEGLPYRGAAVRARVCRAVETGSCLPVPSLSGVELSVPTVAVGSAAGSQAGGVVGSTQRAMLHDALPPALRTGPVRLLTYRVELSNGLGRTAGFGEAAYSAAGAGPGAVAGLRAEGSRSGVVVRWEPEAVVDGSELVLRRELVSGTGMETAGQEARAGASKGRAKSAREPGRRGAQKSGEAGVVWLGTGAPTDPLPGGPHDGAKDSHEAGRASSSNGVVDDGAAMNSTYRYAAERQRTAQLGGHTVVLHGTLSAPVEVALRAVYPPPAPTDLAATAFPLVPADSTTGRGVAVDLIWTPADDANTVGYNVYREAVDGKGTSFGKRVQLNAAPAKTSAWHDVPPEPREAGSARFRYSVTAVDANGLQSQGVSAVVDVSGVS